MIEDFEDFYNHTPPEGVLPVGSTTGFAYAKHRRYKSKEYAVSIDSKCAACWQHYGFCLRKNTADKKVKNMLFLLTVTYKYFIVFLYKVTVSEDVYDTHRFNIFFTSM